MRLPGRLKATSLGDLLGALHRASATGTLELSEDSGRVHRVHLRAGLVSAVELDGASAPLAELLRARGVVDESTLQRSLLRAMASRRLLGDVLVRDVGLSPEVVDAALRHQLRTKLEVLERVRDARVAFRVVTRPPREALSERPLGPQEFLDGRARARDRIARDTIARDPATFEERRARALLGVPHNADDLDVRRAFRRLARAAHPDAHPNATPEERRALEARFAELNAAYQRLSA
jgi:hypothetical protein